MRARKKNVDLTLCRQDFGSRVKRSSHDDLLRTVFGLQDAPLDGARPHRPEWRSLAYFDHDECVATAQTAVLHLHTSDGASTSGGIRLVGVAEPWRGCGLFRDLIERAIRDFAARGVDLLLLYTEEPELYRRFGFETVPQHVFVGPAPDIIPARPACSLQAAKDLGLVEGLLATRQRLSNQVALVDAPSLFLSKVLTDDALQLAFASDLNALLVYEEAEDDMLMLVDVVAAEMPPLAKLLGVLPRRFARVTTRFPPDRLAWDGARPSLDDTGLMARGSLPPAMRQPFMLPPTAEF